MRVHPAGPRSGELSADHPLGLPPSDLNELDKRLWPIGLTREENGALAMRGHDVRDLAAEHGSPVFLMDEEDVRQPCRGKIAAVGPPLFYAGQAVMNVFAQNNQIILFLDELHTLVGAGAADGAIDASNML